MRKLAGLSTTLVVIGHLVLISGGTARAQFNDMFANATMLPPNGGSVRGNNTGATKEPGEPNHDGFAGGHSVWYRWVAPQTSTVTFSIVAPNFTEVLAVYTGPAVNQLTPVMSAEGDRSISFNVLAGTAYSIAVDGAYGDTGGFTVSWSQFGDNRTRVLWKHTSGAVSLWTLWSPGNFTYDDYGPYPGWDAAGLAIGYDDQPRVLWAYVDNSISLWNILSPGFFWYDDYLEYNRRSFQSICVGGDDNAYLLWQGSDRSIDVWRVHSDGSQDYNSLNPPPNGAAIGIGVGMDERPWVMWRGSDLHLTLWRLSNYLDNPASQDYGPYAGWTPSFMAIAPDSLPRVLWKGPSGQVSIWTVRSDMTFTTQDYGPYPGWDAAGMTVGLDGKIHLLWRSTSGQISLWTIDSPGAFRYENYGPFAGWTAIAISTSVR